MTDELFLTEETYELINNLEKFAQSNIDEFRSNFDKFTYDEQILFTDVVHDLEECVINCQIYKLQFEKSFRKNKQLDVYQIIEGDTLVSIANKYYGDPTKWVNIYLINKLIDYTLEAGDSLIIPELEEIDDE